MAGLNMKSLSRNLKQAPEGLSSVVTGLLGVGALVLTATQSLFNVEAGHRAIIFNKIYGVRSSVYNEGTHFKIPFLEKPIVYQVRTRPYESGATPTGTKDLQMVNIRLRVLFRPETDKLPLIYQTLGTNFDDRVLPSIVHEVLKSVVAQFDASQLLTQRSLVSKLVRERLKERAKEFNIALDDVSFTHINFGRDYSAAVEAKQVALQEAERAKFIVEKAEQERRSIVVKAQGEAESAKLISEAIKSNPNFITLRKIEAAREIAALLAKGGNKIYINSDNLLFNTLSHIDAPTK